VKKAMMEGGDKSLDYISVSKRCLEFVNYYQVNTHCVVINIKCILMRDQPRKAYHCLFDSAILK